MKIQAKSLNLPLPVKKVIVVEGGKNMIYIQSVFKNENGEIKGGMFVSKDRGKKWIQINNGLLKNLASNASTWVYRGISSM